MKEVVIIRRVPIKTPHHFKRERVVTIIPAINTPRKIAVNDFLYSRPRIDAIKEPVHAPVPAKGIATNITSPKNSYFSTIFPFFLRLFSNRVYIFFTKFIFKLSFFIKFKNKRRGSTGTMFPGIEMATAFHQGKWNIWIAEGMAPRSSTIGEAEIKNTNISGGILPI